MNLPERFERRGGSPEPDSGWRLGIRRRGFLLGAGVLCAGGATAAVLMTWDHNSPRLTPSWGSADRPGEHYVKDVQLRVAGWAGAMEKGEHYEIDGLFGKMTHQAVKGFQQAVALSVDGIVGPRTWAALDDMDGADGGSLHFPLTLLAPSGDLKAGAVPEQELRRNLRRLAYRLEAVRIKVSKKSPIVKDTPTSMKIHVAYRPQGVAIGDEGRAQAAMHAHGTAAHVSFRDMPADDLALILHDSDFSTAVSLGGGVVHGDRAV